MRRAWRRWAFEALILIGFPPRERIGPALHAAGLLSDRPTVNRRNYEALADHFTTRFTPDMSPGSPLGTLAHVRAVPPVFDIARLRATRGVSATPPAPPARSLATAATRARAPA
jgi:hypothetical protein